VGAGDVVGVEAFFFERSGGDSFEVSVASGAGGACCGGFQLLQNGALGGDISMGNWNVEAFNLVNAGDNDINSTYEAQALWNAVDGGQTAGVSFNVNETVTFPVVPFYNVNNNNTDTELSFDYAGGVGNYPVNRPLNSINSNGPSPPNPNGGVTTQNGNYSIRAEAFLEFLESGTYTIAIGSDDGRRLELTDVKAPGYAGFSARHGQVNGSFTAGDEVVGFSGGTGHNWSLGVFTVNAGDILELDAFYYQGGGGHSGEIALAQGTQTSFSTTTFSLLVDGMFGGDVLLHSKLVPEPTTVAVWSLLGFCWAGLSVWRRRRNGLIDAESVRQPWTVENRDRIRQMLDRQLAK
jgi:hypothetical protein